LIEEFKFTGVEQVVIVDIQLSELISFDESLLLIIRHKRHHKGYCAIKEFSLEVNVNQGGYQVDLFFDEHLKLPELNLR